MSARLPSVKARQVISALEKNGWFIVRQRGSHVTLGKAGVAHIVTVPRYRGDVPRGTLRQIIRDAGLTVEEFVSLL